MKEKQRNTLKSIMLDLMLNRVSMSEYIQRLIKEVPRYKITQHLTGWKLVENLYRC